MDTIRILSTNYSGQSANITFSPATGGTEVISGITIPYDFTDDFVYGDYSVFFTAYGNSCPLSVPVPSPTLSQTGATQYENVVLSASSILDGADYIWTLTDFYNTGDTQVSSYTGQTLIEGYFTSTGNTNVRLDVVLGSATATTTDFVVVEFIPTSISGLLGWYDLSDSSTITFRTGTDYIETINDKSGNNYHLDQSTATYQPLYSASTINGSLSGATFDGIDNFMSYGTGGSFFTTITAMTSVSIGTMLDKNVIGIISGNLLNNTIWETNNSTNNRGKRHATALNGTAYWYDDRFDNDRNAYVDWTANTANYPDNYFVGRESEIDTTGYYYMNNLQMTDYGFPWSPPTFDLDKIVLGSTEAQDTTIYRDKHYGEIGEVLLFESYVADEDLNKLQRYIQYKWYGNLRYTNPLI